MGQRYSLTYLDPGAPVYESRRLQARVGAYARELVGAEGSGVIGALNLELGTSLPFSHFGFTLEKYLKGATTSDFLEAITVIAAAFGELDQRSRGRARMQEWVAFLARAMSQENSKFEIDEQGGVHPRIDAVFALERTAAVTGLGAARYFTARSHFDAAHAGLDERPPATNRSIREIFMANEEVFKLAFPSATKLEVNEIQRRAGHLLDGLATGAERTALNGMIRAADDYVVASHSFRHAQGQPDLPPASMETAAFMIGQGTALLRWLIWLDGKAAKAGGNAQAVT